MINGINKVAFFLSCSEYFVRNTGFYFIGKLFLYRTHTYMLFKQYALFYWLNLMVFYSTNFTSIIYNVNKYSFLKSYSKRMKMRRIYYKMFTPLISIKMIYRFNILRQLWCKSWKGKCHVKGKPVHGQNNWSNGWGSYKVNTTIRKFLNVQKTKRRKKRLYIKTQKNKHKKKTRTPMHSVPKPVKKKNIKKKPVKRKKFDVWS